MRIFKTLTVGILVIALWSSHAHAIEITESSPYLLIGTGDSSVAVAAKVSNSVIGGTTTFDGNVAVTSSTGTFDLSNMDVYANLGVQCAGTAAACTANLSNAFFHPDAFTADPLADGNGLTGGVNFTALLLELAAAASGIPGLAFTATVDLSSDGKISADTTILLASGLNIIDIITDGNDFSLENSSTLTIDGPADAFVIFRLDADEGKNFKISTGDIVIGGSGIGLNNVLFFLDGGRDFLFDNTFLNGVAFWTFGGESVDPALITINNGTGCTQLVAEHINLNDVDLSRCAFISQNGTQVPLPATLLLVASGLGVGLALRAHRRRSSRPDQQVG